MDIKEIQNLIKFVAKSGASEVKLETEDLKITIRTGPLGAAVSEPVYMQQMPMAASPVAPSIEASAPAVQTAPASEDHLITIKSPIIGTFYRRPSPDKANFVEVGSEIGKGDVLCVIEAMKLFNDIESEVSGKIVKVLVDDSSPVEFDQPLFVVDPS
ncbi:MAG TPA: acetyl-CoA carboxylase biotin carboxyl carrier protein [Flavobacteriaceae bacterium]|jgi:acetyl-CoA carboxylase biotin carboxyl carrier protein|nr:acetyl-CoA carboxylase biotin carboxyl carrier protein [Flavobacteriaceae bacterium]MBT5585553.1 acetyl-CoA carboxylase biotin carboxyl carrier protein [Flavobacteriaceae bacterium]MBT5920936.1 acetyl-CoA carboxylase biotin carboxyl carrier protein [Flavobacteriaceae bacterium]MBT7240598.1 acetyl-CoA carboxylase biotin carboxyl carrier protein [Flavobacteriaceae bacterium]MDG1048089.1 acetyl-CoA carboxylase biotin carboxyl carrier protein [Flavobacteriaceae bacterium]